ncbi:MAG: SulP family inorganic anion transporter [Chloroflexi bacterium]|nr:SulP family inorganic anion transporter [Chloroflexota bacterium]
MGEILLTWWQTIEYDAETLRRDVLAGLTVALFALPQSMAYALLAGVEPRYGLYAYIVGAVIGSAFGSSRHLQTGPTNATSIVAASALAVYASRGDFMAVVFTLTLLAGLFQFGAGMLRLGNLTQFISRSVLTGFIAAAGLLIVVNQLPNLLGIRAFTSIRATDVLLHVVANLGALRVESLALGLTTVATGLLLHKYSPRSKTGVPILPSHLLSILFAGAIVWFLGLDRRGVRLVGDIPASLPPFSLPLFDFNLWQSLVPGALAVMLIGVMESISSAKSVASFSSSRIAVDREFVGQGLAKIGVAFFSGIPVSGSLTRSILSYRAGAVTRLANIASGVFLAIIVFVFSPVVRYIPVAALAGMLVLIAVNMVNWEHARISLRATRADAVAMLATFVAALVYPLDIAIYIGVGISLILFLRRVQTPRLSELVYNGAGFRERSRTEARPIPEISIVHVEGDVFFGAADSLEEEIGKIARRDQLQVLILRLKRAYHVDATFVLTLMKLYEDLRRQRKVLLISGATPEIATVFRQSGVDQLIGMENIFFSDATIFKSTRAALDRAIELLDQECTNTTRTARG